MKIKTTLQKVNEALAKMKSVGSVSFDGTNGSFDVKGVEGRFMWDEPDTLTIIIDDKPWFASDSMIENEINKFFN
jgi:hypothetical protein